MTNNLLDICHVNVRSLSDDKINAIEAELMLEYDVICLTETNLPHARVNDLKLNGFHTIMTKNRQGKTGGGVALYAVEHLSVERQYDYELPDLEAMWVKVKAGHNVIHLCICYRPPNSKVDFWTKLQDSVDLVKQSGANNILLTGDFNADPHTRHGHLLYLFSLSNNFTQHVKEPTRITPTSATILDQFISNIPSRMREIQVLDPISTCDHCPIRVSVLLQHNFSKPKAYNRHIWDYKSADVAAFRQNIANTDWDECFSYDSIDLVCEAWTTTFLNAARQTIPNKTITVRPQDKEFFSPELRRLRRKKNRVHRKAKRLNTVMTWTEFREIRNEYNLKIKEAKIEAERKQTAELNNTKNVNPKKWWRLAKSFLKKDSNHTSSYPPLKVGDTTIHDDKEKAESFNSFFLEQTNLDDVNTAVPSNDTQVLNTLSNIAITNEDISDLIKCIDVNKATGPDQVSQAMLKMAGDALVPHLARLFNLSLEKSVFPAMWKRANVMPIFKKDDNAVRNNYRPVSLLSCVSKLFERAVFKYTFNFLRDTGAISLKQSGFMPGDSTTYQLTHLYHIFSEAVDKQKDMRVVFCDISKAFDRVWHVGLLAKLSRIGVVGNLLKWLESYLSERQQRVVINGQHSSWGAVRSGVPQGSVLGPLLFLIYINDITFATQSSEIRLFADDTILYLYVDNPVSNARALNNDLDLISKWASEWLIKFSPAKTKSMIMTKKKHKLNYPPLEMGGTKLENVECHKHLGVSISKDLSWNEHIENIVVNAGKCLDVLNALKFKLNRKTLETLYFAFIRSKLEYANIVWDNCNKQLSDLVESVQYRAAKIVSGAIHRTSHKIVYKELGWESLEERRRKQRLNVFYKAVSGEAPAYLKDAIPQPNAEQNRYSLRNEHNYTPPRTRTSAFHNSFFCKTIRDWNNLPSNTQTSESFDSFKLKLNSENVKAPEWLQSGERYPSIIHARLRMLCSPLNDHLYSTVHVIDSPKCLCGHFRENNKHYLLDCPLYTAERATMTQELALLDFEPTLSNLLNGNNSYSKELNVKGFKVVQDYIRSSNRFK